MKKITLTAALLFALTPFVFADDQAHKKLAEQLLLTMQVDKQVDSAYDRIKATQKDRLKEMNATPDVIESQEKILDMMSKEMGWAKLKDDYVAAYADTFTDEDLQGLVNFYKSPVGQKLVTKTPDLTTKIMDISQKRMKEILPQMQEESAKMMNKIKENAPAASSPSMTPAPEKKK